MMLKPKTIQRISTQQHLLEDSITGAQWICTELSYVAIFIDIKVSLSDGSSAQDKI